MALKLYAAPASEPVTLAEVMAQCRVDLSDESTVLTGFALAARETVEVISRRALITQTWELVLDAFPSSDTIELPRPPLQSVTSITYIDEDGVSHTFSSASYLVDTYGEPGRIVLKEGYTWPSTTLQSANGVVIRFVAGYGAAAAVPEKYKLAIKLLAAHWYENREAVATSGAVPKELPFGVESLLWLDRNF